MSEGAKNPVLALEKTIQIISALKSLERAGVTEIADRLGFGRSLVHNHLSTLETHGFVCQDDQQKYRLGLRFMDFGCFVRNQMDLYRESQPEVQRLAEETGEIASLMAEEHGEGVYLDTYSSDLAVTLDIYPGFRASLHCTALGKAILAHTPRERVEAIVDRHGLPAKTANTITQTDHLFSELDEVRDQGFAIDDEERGEGVRCVAAPITGGDGRALGAISVSGPASRLKGSRLTDELSEQVMDVANIIEVNITYS